jgi:hypothetical protein
MRRALAVLLLSATLSAAACAPGAWLTRQDALNKSTKEKAITHVSRREAKLMLWSQFTRVSGDVTDSTGAVMAGPPGKQKVWLVAVTGDVTTRSGGSSTHTWVILIYNAVSGSLVAGITGAGATTTTGEAPPDWPPMWASYPYSC